MNFGAYAKTKALDRPLDADPRGLEDIFSISAISDQGIFALSDGMYSLAYTLSDINFLGSTDEEQKDIIEALCKVYDAMSCRFQICVANQYVSETVFRDEITYRAAGDGLDHIRASYNDVIKTKVTSARQGLYQTIYLVLTIKAENLSDAEAEFLAMESAARSAFISLGVNGMAGSVMRRLSIDERVQLLYNFTHQGVFGDYRYSFEEAFADKRDFKDIIAPVSFGASPDKFYLNGKVGKVLYASDLAGNLDSDAISRISKINCTSFISINSEIVDIAALKQEITRKIGKVGLSIENQKQQNRNNHDFLADADARTLRKKELLDQLNEDVDVEDSHYFNTTILIAFAADSEAKLKEIEEKIRSTAKIKRMELEDCFLRQIEALNSALPLGVQQFKHCFLLSSPSLSLFVPFRTQELHDRGGTWYGINQISQNAIFADKKRLKNRNGMYLGQSGSGKSGFAKSEMISIYLNEPHDQIMIIDPQGEYTKISDALGGSVAAFDSAKQLYVNPLDIDFFGLEYGQAQELIADKTDFILSLLASCSGMTFSAEEMSLISRVVGRVYSDNYMLRKKLGGEAEIESEYTLPGYMRADRSEQIAASSLSPKEQIREYSPTLQDIYQGLLDEKSVLGKKLAGNFEIFCTGSLNLFNHRTNVDLDTRFLVFDISKLKENLRVPSMLVMLEVVTQKIRSNAAENLWTHIYIDEMHELLGIRQVSDYVLKLWKKVRKMKGVLTGITQNTTDLLANEDANLQAILANSEVFALMSQGTQDKMELMKLLPYISDALFAKVDNAPSGTGLLRMGAITVPFDFVIRRDSLIYELINTDDATNADI